MPRTSARFSVLPVVAALEPRLFLAAQAYDWNNVTMKGTGFINGVVFHPAQQNLIYANTDMGGAYRWDQSESKWTPLTDWIQSTDWSVNYNGAETIAVDPTDPNRVYLGLGTYYGPSAVLRSTDQGRTWLRTNVSFVMNGNGPGRNAGQRMAVDPNSPNILYYGTRRDGIFKSTDYGASWSDLAGYSFTTDGSGPALDVGTDWVLVDKSSGTPGNPSQVLYAGAATSGATKIWRSTDGGTTWAALPSAPATLTASNIYPLRAALTPNGGTLFLTYGISDIGPNNVTGGFVYKVTNPQTASPTWTNSTPAVLSQGGWSGVTLDPNDPNIMFASTIDSWGPIDDIYRSTNGGTNWTKLNANNNRDNSSAPYAGSPNKIHWTGDVQIDPFNPNHVIFNTGYGFHASNNALAATPTWSFFNDGIDQARVNEVVSPSSGAVNLLSAIGDQDGFRHIDFSVSPAAGRLGQSQGLTAGSVNDIDVAWNDANYVVRASRTSPYVQYSNDNGVTWAWFPSGGVSGGSSGTEQITISADGTKTLYEPDGAGRVIYSTRSGSTWSSWSIPATNRPANGAKIVADLVAATTFYAYAGTTLSRSTDGGANWTVMSSTAPSGALWLRAVPDNTGHLLLSTAGNGLWRSTNGGTNWTRINSVSVTTANEVGVGAAAPGQTYPAIFVGGTVGGQNGFFRSDDQGANWTMVSDTSHQYGDVLTIQGDPRVYGRLYVGTNGRGVLYADIHQTPASLPGGWTSANIGSVGSVGGAGFASNEWEVAGGGSGIGGGATDSFRYAYTPLTGDGSITARVTGVPLRSPANNNAKAGVMIRNTTANNSAHAFVGLTPGSASGVMFQARATTGGSTATVGTETLNVWPPYWVRLVRSGNQFTAYRSPDGVVWTQLGTPQTITMGSTVQFGLAVTASDNNQLNIATFENVTISASLAGTSGADVVRLVRNGAVTDFFRNAGYQYSFNPSVINDVTVEGQGSDDQLIIDLAGGNPLPDAGGVFNGGAGTDTITVQGTFAAETVTFSNAAVQYGQSMSLNSVEAATFEGAGGADDVTVTGLPLTFQSSQALGSLTVGAGGSAVLSAGGDKVLALQTLSIAGGSVLDLTDNDLILQYSGSSPVDAIEQLVGGGYNGGDWLGVGITSSLAALDTNFALAVADNATLAQPFGESNGGPNFAGIDVPLNSVLVKFTHRVDLNLDGLVTQEDASLFGGFYAEGAPGATWATGDLDYDGLWTSEDASIFGGFYNDGLPPV